MFSTVLITVNDPKGRKNHNKQHLESVKLYIATPVRYPRGGFKSCVSGMQTCVVRTRSAICRR